MCPAASDRSLPTREMTIFGFALMFAAALCHATWNFFVKRIGGGPELVWLSSIVAVPIYLPLAVLVVATKTPDFGLLNWIFFGGSCVIHLSYFLLLQQGCHRGELSLA